MKDAAERSKQSGFAQAGNTLKKNMTAGEKADENAIDHLLLADDDLADFAAHLIEVAGGKLEWGVGSHLFILAVDWQDAAWTILLFATAVLTT